RGLLRGLHAVARAAARGEQGRQGDRRTERDEPTGATGAVHGDLLGRAGAHRATGYTEGAGFGRGGPQPGAGGHNGGVRLRVMTYNVRGLKDDEAAVVEVLRAATPDVVALQEPPRGPLGRRRLARLAERAGLEVLVGGGGARTTALLARPGLPVGTAYAMRLPARPLRTRRGLATADVAGLRVVSVHLGLAARERSRQLVRILPLVAAAPDCVVAGDLNEPPGGPTW